jgi:hypothetical protein
MGLSLITGGQYIRLPRARFLSQVIATLHHLSLINKLVGPAVVVKSDYRSSTKQNKIFTGVELSIFFYPGNCPSHL